MIDEEQGNDIPELTDDLIDVAPEQEQAEEEGESLIGFADEIDAEAEEETPLVKRLRDQNRELSRKLAKTNRPATANDDDPEPAIPPKKTIEQFDYDQDKLDDYIDQRDEAVRKHAAWEAREERRKEKRQTEADAATRAVEQQRKALNVTDYEDQSAKVQAALSETQLAILISGVENPAKLIYALGRSAARLDQIAAEDNPVKFAVMLGKLEKEIRVAKRVPPPVEGKVRGATASVAIGASDRELERLEKEADRTGDRSKVIAYRRAARQNAA